MCISTFEKKDREAGPEDKSGLGNGHRGYAGDEVVAIVHKVVLEFIIGSINDDNLVSYNPSYVYS